MLANILTTFFAPAFIISLHYFEFKKVVLSYLLLSIILFIYTIIKKKQFKDFIIPIIYIMTLIFIYFYTNYKIIKFIPIIVSVMFFVFFLDATINKKELILKFTQKFYSKKLSHGEILFLKNGDLFWAIITCINVFIQSMLALQKNDVLWLFYNSIGWYIFFFISLLIQIIYGRFYAIRLSGK